MTGADFAEESYNLNVPPHVSMLKEPHVDDSRKLSGLSREQSVLIPRTTGAAPHLLIHRHIHPFAYKFTRMYVVEPTVRILHLSAPNLHSGLTIRA